MKTVLKLFMTICIASQSFSQNLVSQEKEIISGIVLDEDGNPFPHVTINIQDTADGTQTNLFGNYSLNVSVGKTLIFNFNGYANKEVKVLNANTININMKRTPIRDGDVVMLAMGLEKKKDRIGYGYKEVNNNLLTHANNPNALVSLDGKVSGLDVLMSSNGNVPAIRLRGNRSLRGDNNALVVIDGAISTYAFFETLDPYLIDTITVLKGANGAALYGSQGSNGVVVVKLKKGTGSVNNTKFYKPKTVKYRGSLKVKNTNTKPSYIKALKRQSSPEKAYKLYETQREDYKDHNSYYVDVYSFFANANDKENSKKVLNDVVISNIDNYETLKGLAMKLQADKEYDLASSVYKRLLILRPRNAQSYIDLAQIYNEKGKTQRAFNLFTDLLELTKAASKINGVVKNEVNAMLQTSKNIDDSKLESYYKLNSTFDIRILASWNRENSNVNLQVIDPSLEIASKDNPRTRLGGELINVNDAFGPEEYTIRNARKGDYFIGLKYNDANKSKDEAVFVKLIIYKNFGKRNQKKEVKIIKLDKSNGESIVAKITI
ncbi:carboxypeptidase-like regulatory domain-containing protein [Lacinutrix jangbogonensis]|uniref:carboxypeptidase-like regulatory domain-containing protein n=1 Tax=Lacinutrix jangbogonensis TaxID=1469557 RepID=UPI00053E7CC7|nr:carboxypeptidase-like regulatory domain-containing protein [Lacinutrix jangbogonensis]